MEGKKWFPLARKSQLSVTFSKNKLFFWKLLSPNSNDSFYQQQYSSDQKNTFSTKQKIRLYQPDEGYWKIGFHRRGMVRF